ncbi:peptidase family c78 protein [Cardiosporidium cionae]|uniref:Peptidase family c78 protein n=1 Tax=Cardiosporidium cionae TaxID=476202 RepID=A0ABQ7J674_9APIC|nr:peptidase family c78 protein [Cardiosporidium cionae]|eukprot:KAF8819474.1 peptidase family c78 protein [Cardiosporidium cionae]
MHIVYNAYQGTSMPPFFNGLYVGMHTRGNIFRLVVLLQPRLLCLTYCVASVIKNLKNIKGNSFLQLKLVRSTLSLEFPINFEYTKEEWPSSLSLPTCVPLSALPSAGRIQLKAQIFIWQKLLQRKDSLWFYDAETSIGFSQSVHPPLVTIVSDSNSFSQGMHTLPITFFSASIRTSHSPEDASSSLGLMDTPTLSLPSSSPRISFVVKMHIEAMALLPQSLCTSEAIYGALRSSFLHTLQQIEEQVMLSFLPCEKLAWNFSQNEDTPSLPFPNCLQCELSLPEDTHEDALHLHLQIQFHTFTFPFSSIPLCFHSVEMKAIRRYWLDIFELEYRPLFVSAAALPSSSSSLDPLLSTKLINPHATLASGPKWISSSYRSLHLVQGLYEYFHYDQVRIFIEYPFSIILSF